MFGSKFLGPPSNPAAGVKKLESIILEKLGELQSLVQIIKYRAKCDENYASELMKSKIDQNTESQTTSTSRYWSELIVTAESRRTTSSLMNELCRPLDTYISESKKQMSPQVDHICKGWEKYSKMLKVIQQLESSTRLKYKMLKDNVAESETKHEAPEELDPIKISEHMSFSIEDFNDLIGQLQGEVKSEDVWHIFGNFKECYKGSDLLEYLQAKDWTENDGINFLEYLTSHGFIKAIKQDSTVVISASYQWKRTVLDIPGDSHHTLKSDAKKSAFKLKSAVRQMEKAKLDVEMAMKTFFEFAETSLINHISMIKETLSQLINMEGNNINALRKCIDNVSVYIETVDVARQIKSITEKDKTGYYPVPTFIPKKFLDDDQHPIFGVSLEEHCTRLNATVPPFIRVGIQYLKELTLSESTKSTPLDWWLDQKCNISLMYALRKDLNGANVKKRMLSKYPPLVIVGALKQYLIELPISLCPDEVYLPLKMVYLSKTDNDATDRLNSVRNILGIVKLTSNHAKLPFSDIYVPGGLLA